MKVRPIEPKTDEKQLAQLGHKTMTEWPFSHSFGCFIGLLVYELILALMVIGAYLMGNAIALLTIIMVPLFIYYDFIILKIVIDAYKREH